jgi:hypothetical protein
LDLAFETKSLRALCESEAKARRMLGGSVAEYLKRRLADLHAATSVLDLVASPPLQVGDPGLLAIELGDGYRVVFAANHAVLPTLASGAVDWAAVDPIKLLRIERHG